MASSSTSQNLIYGRSIVGKIAYYTRVSFGWEKSVRDNVKASVTLAKLESLLAQKRCKIGISAISRIEGKAGEGVADRFLNDFLRALIEVAKDQGLPIVYPLSQLIEIVAGDVGQYEKLIPLSQRIEAGDQKVIEAKFNIGSPDQNMQLALNVAHEGILIYGAEKLLAEALNLSVGKIKDSAIAQLLLDAKESSIDVPSEKPKEKRRAKVLSLPSKKTMSVAEMHDRAELVVEPVMSPVVSIEVITNSLKGMPIPEQVQLLKAIVYSLEDSIGNSPEDSIEKKPLTKYTKEQVIGLQVGGQILKQARELQGESPAEFAKSFDPAFPESVVLASENAGMPDSNGEVSELDKEYSRTVLESELVPVTYDRFIEFVEGHQRAKYLKLRSLRELIDLASKDGWFNDRVQSLQITKEQLSLFSEAKLKTGDEITLSELLALDNAEVVDAQIAQIYQKVLAGQSENAAIA